MANAIFDASSEKPEKPHVADQVQPAAVQERVAEEREIIIKGKVMDDCPLRIRIPRRYKPMAVDIVPASRLASGIGIYALTMPIGMTIGPLFGLALMKAGGAYLMFLATLGVSLLSVVAALFARVPGVSVQRTKFSLSSLFSVRVLPISFCMFLVMTAYGAISVFVTIYAAQRGFSNLGQFFLCFSVAMFLSRFFVGGSMIKAIFCILF